MTLILRLFVTGRSGHTQQALKNLETICQEELEGDYKIEVIDVLENPQLAEDEKILATPTLIKMLPPPLRKIVGDLSNREKVLLGLDLVRHKADNKKEERP